MHGSLGFFVLIMFFFKAHSTLGGGSSDMFKLLSAVGAYEYEGGSVTFCDSNFLRHKAMEEIHKLRAQVMRLVMVHFPKANAGLDPSLAPPSELQVSLHVGTPVACLLKKKVCVEHSSRCYVSWFCLVSWTRLLFGRTWWMLQRGCLLSIMLPLPMCLTGRLGCLGRMFIFIPVQCSTALGHRLSFSVTRSCFAPVVLG